MTKSDRTSAQNTVLFPPWPVLVVDDEQLALQSSAIMLEAAGINNVAVCQDSRKVIRLMAERNVGVVLLDLAMPHISGQELLVQMAEEYPDVPIIVITGFNEIDMAVRCMKAGALDYMVKPVEANRLVSSVRRAIEARELRTENALLRKRMFSDELEHPEAFEDLVTRDPGMRNVFRYVEAVGPSSQALLIIGATGVGKELLARAAHCVSGRTGPFVPVNIAGVDDDVFSDTLFGHVRGAFTGADSVRAGLVEKACGGTLFLDEIGDLSTASQVKLLRLLQEREYFPLGTDVPKQSEARVVVATHRDLASLQTAGDFRKDLFYRLQTHQVEIPPLSKRLDDIPLLLEHFLRKVAAILNKEVPTCPPELLTLLKNYDYPGNVRELESMVFDALSNHRGGVLSMEIFRARIRSAKSGGTSPLPEAVPPGVDIQWPEKLPTLREATQQLIDEALSRSKGNQAIASQLLGISRPALNRRLRRSSDREDK